MTSKKEIMTDYSEPLKWIILICLCLAIGYFIGYGQFSYKYDALLNSAICQCQRLHNQTCDNGMIPGYCMDYGEYYSLSNRGW